MRPDPRIRRVEAADWDDIVALEAGAYTDLGLSEGRAELLSRARVSPATCFVLAVERRTVGYVLSLPYPMFRYPDMARREVSGLRSRNLLVHDLVVADECRGRGLATRLLRHLTATARRRRYETMSLVAVSGSDIFWAAQGYQPHSTVVLPDSYGPNAVYMSTTI